MTKLLSYHNDPKIKDFYAKRFAAHRAIDAVIQGTGYDAGYKDLGRGCFVGCTLQNYDHSQFPVELGWPEWLARLADTIFEGLPKAEAPQFGTDLLAAAPVGVDLEPVKYHLAIARHERQLARIAGNNEPYADQVRAALQGVIDWARNMLAEYYSGESAARSAAWSAAWSAAESAESAAWSAESASAWSAESAAESAAWSAWSAAASAAASAWSASASAAASARSASASAAASAAASARSASASAAASARSAARSTWWADSSAWAEFQIERDTLLTVLRSMEVK